LSTPASPVRFLSWNIWLAWILVCAAEPIFSAAWAMELEKLWLPSDPYAESIAPALGVVIMAGPIALVLLKWAILRRVAPTFRLWAWLATLLVATAVWLLLVLKFGDLLYRIPREFSVAAFKLRPDFSVWVFLGLPWGRLFLATAAVTAATALAPAWAFARAAGLRWYVPLLAAVVGACTLAAADQVYDFYGFHVRKNLGQEAMNSWSWMERAQELWLRAGTAALGAAIGGLAFAVLIARGAGPGPTGSRRVIRGLRGVAATLAAALVIAVAAPAGRLALDPAVRAAGYDWLSKALSRTPSHDVAEGEEILRYSHTASVAPPTPPRYPTVSFAPDGSSLLTLDADRRLRRIDTATGREAGTLGERLGPYEGYAVAWSPDGRFLALRTDGEAISISGTPYTRHRARFRVYSLPDYHIVGEYSRVGGYPRQKEECFDSHADPSMMFEADGGSLWVLCTQYDYPTPKSLMAIQLEIPSMKVLGLRYYGDDAAGEAVRGLTRAGGSIWYWQWSSAYSHQFRVGDLGSGREVAHLPDLKQSHLAGDLVSTDARITEGRITLRYRNNSWPPAITRWLVFDTRSGQLLERRDEAAAPFDPGRAVLKASDDLRIETISRQDSLAGEIDVLDSASGRRRQHIRTLAQRPIGISPDGHWLVMHAFEQKTLRVYRVGP
jgi:hypothetical protein